MARTKKSKITDQVKSKAKSRKKIEKKEPVRLDSIVSTGSTMLNLACSDRHEGGWQKGKMANVIGDSHSGKSILGLSIFAEAARDPRFDDYEFYYDDAEAAREFNMEKLFGKKATERVKAPDYDEDGNEKPSDTIQDFHMYLRRLLKKNKPFIYVLDSYDALDSEEDEAQVEAAMAAREKGNKPSGSYGMAKAKGSSAILRDITMRLKQTNSILIIISQTRQNINPMSFSKKTRSGGDALKFYATHEIWTGIVQSLTKTVNKKKLPIGVQVRVRVEKTKLTGKKREIEFPIYYDLGIDDVSSCIDFLVEEGHWEKQGKKSTKIIADDLDFEGSREKLVQKIENENLEDEVRAIAQKVWDDREEKLKLNRKSRYD